MAGDGEVADLPRHLGGVVMAQTVAIELLERGAFHDVAVPLGAEARNVDLRNQVAIFRVFRLYRRIALLGFGDGDRSPVVAGVAPVDGLGGFVLGSLRLDTGPPHLPDDVQGANHGSGNQQFGADAECLPDRAPLGRRRAAYCGTTGPCPTGVGRVCRHSCGIVLGEGLYVRHGREINGRRCAAVVPAVSHC